MTMTPDLRERLEAMSTPELLDVLTARDADEWRPEVFPAVEEILRSRGIDPPPPDSGAETTGPSHEGLVRVTSLMDAMAANLCRMALQEAGIEAFVSNEHLAGASPPLGIALGFDILVQREEATAAREVLAALESGEAAIPLEPEPCPKCQSLDTERGPKEGRLQAVGSFVFFDTPRSAPSWRSRCRDCGHVWE